MKIMLPSNKNVIVHNVQNKFNQRQKIALGIVTIIDLMSFCSIEFMSLFLPQDTAKRGETLNVFNLSIKFSALTIALTALPFGALVPKFGIKNAFLGGVVLSRISTALYGTLHFIHNETIFTLLSYLLRGFEAMGECAYVITGYVIVFSTFPEDVGMIRGLLEAIVSIGGTIGPAVGELIITVQACGIPFYAIGFSVIAFAILGAQLIDEPKECLPNDKTLREFLKIPIVIVTSVVVVVMSMTLNALDPTLRDHITTLFPHIQTGHVYLLLAATFAIFSPLWGYLSETLPRFEWMIPIGLYLNGFFLLIIDPTLFTQSLQLAAVSKLAVIGVLGVVLALALVPTFHCLTVGALQKEFKYSLTTHSYVVSTWTFMFAIGEMLGPNIGQLIYAKYNFAATAVVIASINFVVGAICIIFLICKSKNRSLFCSFNITIYFD